MPQVFGIFLVVLSPVALLALTVADAARILSRRPAAAEKTLAFRE